MSLPSAQEILKQAHARAKQKNPSFSLRSLAKKMQVSPAFLSQVFNGKAPVPENRIEDFRRCLNLDQDAVRQLKQSFQLEKLQYTYSTGERKAVKPDFSYETLSEKAYRIFEYWYYPAILDLTTCSNFVADPHWIAKRLGIKVQEVERALRYFFQSGYLEEREGKWVKASRKIRIPTTRSHPLMRQHNKNMARKGVENLLKKTSDEDYKARKMCSISFAASPERVAQAKEVLTQAMYEVADIMAEDADPKELTEIYNLSVMFFPLTEKD